MPTKFGRKYQLILSILLGISLVLVLAGVSFAAYRHYTQQVGWRDGQIASLEAMNQDVKRQLEETRSEFEAYKNTDQVKRNDELQDRLEKTEKVFQETLKVYEQLIDFKEGTKRANTLDNQYATILTDLSKLEYASAEAKMKTLSSNISAEVAKQALIGINTDNVAVNNSPPGAGYARQKVQTSAGEFIVDIITADLNSTRVVVDTASDGTCADNCPVLPLATYVQRSGAFAGINGSYFCPESYPQCAGKKNSFDTLLMNKNKVYFNSDNNVYSDVPAAIFSGNSGRFVGRSSEWGRDTGVDAVIANRPLLLMNKETQFGGDADPKLGSRGVRGFLGVTGSNAHMGFVRGATVAEAAIVLKTMGLDHAINLDSGGSSALWSGGYKVGPGRSIPNAVLFVRK